MAGAQSQIAKGYAAMLNICCVKWGTAYGPEYVNRLHAMVRRHMLEHDLAFHCFTDDRRGIEPQTLVHSLPEGLEGWWNKLVLFRPGNFPRGSRIVYFDLDTVILGSIDALGYCQSDFAALRDFYRPRGIGSGVMLWEAGQIDDFWTRWVEEDYPTFSSGDQAWIEIMAHRKWGHHILPHRQLQNLYPGMFASFKADCADGPGNARVVCFHGQPKPHNCGALWVADAWTDQPVIREAAE